MSSKSHDAALEQALGKDRVSRRVALAPYTTFKIGGPADLFFEARTGAGVEDGRARCGAAGALLVVVMGLLTPFHAILGAVLQLVLGRVSRTRV